MITINKKFNNKIINILLLVLFFFILLVGSITIFDGFEFLFATFTNKCFNIYQNIAPLLVFISGSIIIINYLYNCFKENINKKKELIILIMTSIILVISIFFYLLNFKYLCDSIVSLLKRKYYDSIFIEGIILLFFNILFIIFNYVFLFKKQNLDIIKFTFKENKLVSFITPLELILFLYNLKSLFVMITLNQHNLIGQLFFIFFIMVNIYNFLYIFKIFVIKNKIINLISSILPNLLAFLLLIILEINNFSFLVHIMKPVCPLTYAISLPIYLYLLIFNMLFAISISLFRFFKKDKNLAN